MYYNVNKQNEDDKNSNAKRNQKNMKLSEKEQIDSSDIFMITGYKTPLFERRHQHEFDTS